jgi:hypothetical protein
MDIKKKKEILEKTTSSIKDFFEKEKISNANYKITSELKKDNSALNEEIIEINIETSKEIDFISETSLFEMLEKEFDEKENYGLYVKLENQKVKFYFESSEISGIEYKWNRIEYLKTETNFLNFLKKISEYKNFINNKNYITVSFENGSAFLKEPKLTFSFESRMLEKLGFEYKEQLFEYSVNGYENFECNDLTYSDEKTEIVRIKCEDMKLIRALVSGIDEMYSPLVNAARKILEHKNK